MFSSHSSTLNIAKLTVRNATLTGSLSIKRLPRLVSLLADDAGEIDFQLSFAREAGRQVIRGHFQTKVWMRCQRCLEPVQVPLEGEIGLERVMDETQALKTELDPLLLADDEEVQLSDLIEDEIILALPVVAMHEDVGCNASLPETTGQALEDDQQVRTLPFAQLRDLLNKD
jgi:uncharacterized protein